jgi:hypothetical protein
MWENDRGKEIERNNQKETNKMVVGRGFFRICREIVLGGPYWWQEYIISQGRRSERLEQL